MWGDDGGGLDGGICHKRLQASQSIEETVSVDIDGRVDSEALPCRRHIPGESKTSLHKKLFKQMHLKKS